MRRGRLSSLGIRGDTIVEVLLAIAVVSAVLGGAFVSANRSLQGSRASQERGEALKLIEGQLELMKAALNDPGHASGILTATSDFCLDDTLTPIPPTDSRCRQGPDGRYRLSINRSANTYTATARWDKFGGGEQETISIVYRAYDL